MWKRLTLVLLGVSAVLALLAYGFTRNPREITTPLLGKEAPDFTLPLFAGKEVRLADLRGKVVFLNFWASWCIPCRDEARDLEAASRKYKDQNVVFLGVNTQDREEDAREFLKEFGVSYPNGRDADGRVTIAYGVWGIPETFMISPGGIITYKHIGAMDAVLLSVRIAEARAGVVSAQEGRGEYQSVR